MRGDGVNGAADTDTAGPLDGIRVLEFGGALTNYCGKMFAELGADVILVEPPHGDDLRLQPPYADLDHSDPEASLQYFYRNTSKKSIVLDLDNPDGVATFSRLASSVDLVLEGQTPGVLGDLGIGYEDLARKNPTLVMTSITPFGQTGPYAHYEHSDLICMAFGGMLWMGGYADGPPVRPVGDQAYMAGSLFGSVASMIALTHAELTGEGQHVDVSVQESVAMGLENAAQYFDFEQHIRTRFGGTQKEAGFGIFPCRDGHVFLLASGIGGNRFWSNLVAWMVEENVQGSEVLGGPQWGAPDFMATDEAKSEFWEIFTNFSTGRTKNELYHEAQEWRVPLGPVNKPSDVYRSTQLLTRGYFVDMDAFGQSFQMPGAPYQLSDTPWQITGPAPSIGEHTDSVLADFGFDADEAQRLRAAGAVS
jgi:benzylsuccinate CoA-transferase BbsE subunit